MCAQPDFELNVLNPVGFVAPGQSETIIVEVFNPIDSGVDITGFSGAGHRGGFPSFDVEKMRERRMAAAMANAKSRQAGGCGRRNICPLSGSFPVKPGQSMQISYLNFHVPEDIQIGSEIQYSNMSLKIEIDGQTALNAYYTDKNVIRIVTSTGTGDASLFDDFDLWSPLAGVLSSNLAVRFDYPKEVSAGDAFMVSATISNGGSTPIMLHNVLNSSISGFYGISGTHWRSFRFVPCQQQCLIAGELVLQPGDSISYELGTYHYENDLLFNGELILDGYRLYIGDDLQRDGFSRPQENSLVIKVRGPFGGTAENEFNLVPEVAPLELRDLLKAGDSQVILDPNTGYEWLKLTASEGYSDAELMSETGAGGLFEGFKLASSAQVEELLLNHVHSFGYNLQPYALYLMANNDTRMALSAFLDLIGTIDSSNSKRGVIGRVKDPISVSSTATNEFVAIEISGVDSMGPGGFALVSSLDGIRKYATATERTNYGYIGYWLLR